MNASLLIAGEECAVTGAVGVNPLRFPFDSHANLLDHCALMYPEQSVAWRYREYLRAGVMARRNLSKLFDKMTAIDLEIVYWDEIAEDVCDLSTLASNPE